MAPPRKIAPKRAARSAAPKTETRLPGGPTPPSAAATAPRGFYSPDEKAPATSGFTAQTRQTAIPADEETTEDHTLAPVTGFAPEGETPEQAASRIRALRQASGHVLGSYAQKLAYAKRPGYYRHWFNDSPGRIQEAQDSGWAFVIGKNGQSVQRHVDVGRDKKGLQAFLMEIPEEIWLEDLAVRNREAQARVEGIKKAPFRAEPGKADRSDAGKFYSPHEDPITIGQSLVRG